jgi:general secretion pathway protein F
MVTLAADAVAESGLVKLLSAPVQLGSGASRKDVQLLTRELAVLLKAGVTLEEAIGLLQSVTGNKALKSALAAIAADLREGASLAAALAKHRTLFDEHYCSLVRAGEQSGQLEDTLEELARFLERSQAIRDSITSALIYPLILAVLVVMTLVLVVAVVLPEFQPLFDDLGGALPLPTRIAMGLGTFIQTWWWALILLAAGGIAAFLAARQRPESRAKIDRFWLRLPMVGALLRKIETARFTRTLGALLRGGLPLPRALALAVDGIENAALAGDLKDIVPAVREGGGLTNALSRSDALPDLALRLIRIGEQSGRLDAMLAETAGLYEQDVKTALERLMAALVPALTIGMGLIIAGLIASVLLGVMSINQLAAG